jgi:hypothetical protein
MRNVPGGVPKNKPNSGGLKNNPQALKKPKAALKGVGQRSVKTTKGNVR